MCLAPRMCIDVCKPLQHVHLVVRNHPRMLHTAFLYWLFLWTKSIIWKSFWGIQQVSNSDFSVFHMCLTPRMCIESSSVCFHVDLWSWYVTHQIFCELENQGLMMWTCALNGAVGHTIHPWIFKFAEIQVCNILRPQICMKTHTATFYTHLESLKHVTNTK